jgi:hypothetical protein
MSTINMRATGIMISCMAWEHLSHLMAGLRGNSRMARKPASASRPIMMEVHMKAISSMESLMDREPTAGQVADNTRASSSKTEAMATENRHSKMELTRATSKTTVPMALESNSTLLRTNTKDNGKMGCFTGSAHCTLDPKGR